MDTRRQPDPQESHDAEQHILTPNSDTRFVGPSRIRSWQRQQALHRPASSSSSSSAGSLDDSGSEYGGLADGHGNCAAFTVQLIQTLLGMRGRQQQHQSQQDEQGRRVCFETHPLTSPHLYPNASAEQEVGDVRMHCWEIAGGADAEATPLQPALLEGSDVVVLCFDLVHAQLNREVHSMEEERFSLGGLRSSEGDSTTQQTLHQCMHVNDNLHTHRRPCASWRPSSPRSTPTSTARGLQGPASSPLDGTVCTTAGTSCWWARTATPWA